MRRRALLAAITGALLAPPRAAWAQQPAKVPRVGIIAINPRSASFFQAFEQRLRELGWTDGGNLTIVFRTPRTQQDSSALANELVRQNVDLIVAGGPEVNLKAAKQATGTIPIVMVALNYDPIEKGYVTSVARPGGNITGVWSLSPEQGPKQLEFLKEMFPKAARFGVLWEAFATDQLPLIDASAQQLGVELEKVEVRPPYDFDQAMLTLKQRRVAAVLVVSSPIVFRERARIAELALKHRLPAGGGITVVESGLVLGFGVHPNVPYRRAADYVDKILRGAKPGDLPVEQPTKYELVINLKAAKALGLVIPQSLLLRADRVVE